MSCTGCAARLGRVISKMAGVAKAEVDFSSTKMVVEFDPAVANVAKIVALTKQTGYEAFPAA